LKSGEDFMGYKEKNPFIKLCNPGFLLNENQKCPIFSFGKSQLLNFNKICEIVYVIYGKDHLWRCAK
jgi:hypothetical protein